ncbi:hypothetical protein HPP92_010593 [Vanilla planifolia]|uniref:SAM domain-containing protein n=1 Tax=Vanilla planifolia TaxID=51239 RepID=A0A835R175_VANPL|nr:hypothetical protein HPP92_010593 [Vanilla planifolia]
MDWHTWLSKSSGLDPGLVYEYSVLLSHNELEEDDIVHFDHEFLQSMGIAIAKHRLEILKLAKKERRRSHLPVAAFLAALRKAHKCLTRYFHEMARLESKAVVTMPRPAYGIGRWRVNDGMKGSRRLGMGKQERLLITDGIHGGAKAVHPRGSPLLRRISPQKEEKKDNFCTGKADAEEMRWDCMFRDLKPT